MDKLHDSFFLLPSKIFVSKTPVDVMTVLGSCVSVCLWDKDKKIGGINHYMLPLYKGKDTANAKYGNIAMQKLIAKMILLGAKKEHLIAKIFGGSESLCFETSVYRVGEQNIEIARRILKAEGIPIHGESTGTRFPRKILFNTSTGNVSMKYLVNPVSQLPKTIAC